MKLLLLLISLISLGANASSSCIAHRALGFGEIENSFKAIEVAAAAGVDAIEFDLLHTKDKETIIYHDKTLNRHVRKSDACPIGSNVSTINSKDLLNCRLNDGQSIPLFSETMEMLSNYDSMLFIELKDTFTANDLAIIKKNFPTKAEKIVIISFDRDLLIAIKSMRKTDQYLRQIKLVLVKRNGLTAKTKELDGLDAKIMTKRRVKRLSRQGKISAVYTKNTEEKINNASQKGVNYITTNNYTLCKSLN